MNITTKLTALPLFLIDNSIGALHRLPGSDSDTLHSSSPSTHSTRSTHSTGLLQTFHPQPVVVTMAPPAQPPAMEYGHYVQREPAVALIHAVPGTEGSGAEYAGPAAEAQHAPRPPDQQDKGGSRSKDDWLCVIMYDGLLECESQVDNVDCVANAKWLQAMMSVKFSDIRSTSDFFLQHQSNWTSHITAMIWSRSK